MKKKGNRQQLRYCSENSTFGYVSLPAHGQLHMPGKLHRSIFSEKYRYNGKQKLLTHLTFLQRCKNVGYF
jgi:hypothetical protein